MHSERTASVDRGEQKPNILLIMADQMTPFLTGAYGHPVVKTPNLDRLVEQGVRFDAAYTNCPLCGPARASLMTGRYASNIRCYDNASPLSCDQPSIAHYLSIEGYDTVASGKMHFIGPDQLHGFRKRLTTDIYPSDFVWTTTREHKNRTMWKGITHAAGYATPKVGVREWSIDLAYDEEVSFRALEYIRARVDTGSPWRPTETHKPFFLCVSFNNPHGPFHVTQELWDLYEGEHIEIPEFPDNVEETYSSMDRWLYTFHGVDRVPLLRDPESLYALRRSYYGLVSYVDRKVGELLKTLEDTGLGDSTIIIFASDHGDMLCEKGLVQKKMFYEWSARVPLIITFPDSWPLGDIPSRVCKEPVSLVDLAPTILDMAGVGERLPLDGKSLIGLLQTADEGDAGEREVFSEMHTEGVFSTCFMIRRGRYKYVYVHGEDSQLFDLEADPGEWNNLAGVPEFKDVEAELKARILDEFNPDEIEGDVRASLLRRRLIKKAMRYTGTHWDYAPEFDATKQYIRGDYGPQVDD